MCCNLVMYARKSLGFLYILVSLNENMEENSNMFMHKELRKEF